MWRGINERSLPQTRRGFNRRYGRPTRSCESLGRRQPVPSRRRAAQSKTFAISNETVSGPTPPGTGLIASTRPRASGWTSPTSRPSASTLVPTSTTHEEAGRYSARTSPGAPAAATTTCALANAARSCSDEVRVWQMVTVPCLCMSSSAAARPTLGLLPTTTQLVPSNEPRPYHSSSDSTAQAVQGSGISSSPK